MIQKTPADNTGQNVLTPEEQVLLDKLQQLAAEGCEEVPPELLTLINRTLKWNLSDPASLERALYFTARDPFYQREVGAIDAEFGRAEEDRRKENRDAG